jgi:hypothetical protein
MTSPVPAAATPASCARPGTGPACTGPLSVVVVAACCSRGQRCVGCVQTCGYCSRATTDAQRTHLLGSSAAPCLGLVSAGLCRAPPLRGRGRAAGWSACCCAPALGRASATGSRQDPAPLCQAGSSTPLVCCAGGTQHTKVARAPPLRELTSAQMNLGSVRSWHACMRSSSMSPGEARCLGWGGCCKQACVRMRLVMQQAHSADCTLRRLRVGLALCLPPQPVHTCTWLPPARPGSRH